METELTLQVNEGFSQWRNQPPSFYLPSRERRQREQKAGTEWKREYREDPPQDEATMLPCSTSPAVAPVAAATAAAAAVTEAGEVVCLLPTVKSPVPNQTRKKTGMERGGKDR